MIELQNYNIITGETIHSQTKNINNPADGQIVDLGVKHEYRYISLSGIPTVSGTQNVTYTTNGERTIDVTNYENININVNVPNTQYYNAIYQDISEHFGTGMEAFTITTPFTTITRAIVMARVPNSQNNFLTMIYSSEVPASIIVYKRDGSGNLSSSINDIGIRDANNYCIGINGERITIKIAISYKSTEVYTFMYGT